MHPCCVISIFVDAKLQHFIEILFACQPVNFLNANKLVYLFLVGMLKTLYHEKQVAALCAVHCINNLLQHKALSEIDLMQIAHQLDSEEEALMSTEGTDSKDYQTFKNTPSQNVDNSGNFSVGVIVRALQVFGLKLHHFASKECALARENPTQQQAYICNLQEHWLTLRKIGPHWFNLNSLLQQPEYVAPLYLTLYLEQLKAEGYSIFVVQGKLPDCAADVEIFAYETSQIATYYAHVEKKKKKQKQIENDEDAQLRQAIAQSMSTSSNNNRQDEEEDDDEMIMARALSLSMMKQ